MACPFSKFCLGMCKWTNCPGLYGNHSHYGQDQPISPSHSPSSSRTSSTLLRKCFSAFDSDNELAVLSKGVVLANTDKSTRWASTSFFSQADLDELFSTVHW